MGRAVCDACSEPNTRVWQRQSCLVGVAVRASLLKTSKVLSKLYASTSKHYRKHSSIENTLQKYTRVHLMLALSRSAKEGNTEFGQVVTGTVRAGDRRAAPQRTTTSPNA